jgi:hypothetical protein
MFFGRSAIAHSKAAIQIAELQHFATTSENFSCSSQASTMYGLKSSSRRWAAMFGIGVERVRDQRRGVL